MADDYTGDSTPAAVTATLQAQSGAWADTAVTVNTTAQSGAQSVGTVVTAGPWARAMAGDLADAFLTAATAATGAAAAAAIIDAEDPDSESSTSIAAHIAAIKAAGKAIRDAGGPHVQGGVVDPAKTGWIGHKGQAGTDEGILGFAINGVDDVVWNYAR